MGPTARIVDFFDRGRRAQPPISLVAKERIEKVKVSEGHLYWPTFQGLHPPHPSADARAYAAGTAAQGGIPDTSHMDQMDEMQG